MFCRIKEEDKMFCHLCATQRMWSMASSRWEKGKDLICFLRENQSEASLWSLVSSHHGLLRFN